MKKTHKIILICTLCCLLFTALCTTALAQPINNDASELIRADNLLLVPRECNYYKREDYDATGAINGYAFHSNPIFAPVWVQGERHFIRTQGNTTYADFVGASYMSSLTASVEMYNSGDTEYYRTLFQLSNAGNSLQTHEYVGQFYFRDFAILNGTDQNAFIIYKRNTTENVMPYTMEVLTFEDGVGFGYKIVRGEFDMSNSDRINIRQLYDIAVNAGAYTGQGYAFIRSFTLRNVTTDGSLYIYQDRETIGGSVRQYYSTPLFDAYQDTPLLLEWLSVAVGGFFDTTIFAIGNINIKIGTLFLIPLSCWIVVLFVKKFAGG